MTIPNSYQHPLVHATRSVRQHFVRRDDDGPLGILTVIGPLIFPPFERCSRVSVALQPAARAHDRRHDGAQLRREDAPRLYPARTNIHSLPRPTAFLGRSPDTAMPEDLRRFQLHQTQTGVR
jgi:hypothetical protein